MILACKPIQIAVFASGRGTNALNLVEYAQRYPNKFNIQCLICDNPDAEVIEKIRRYDIITYCIPFPSSKKGSLIHRKHLHEREILKTLERGSTDWVCLAGYMRVLSPYFLQSFYDDKIKGYRVLNIHPSLLPKFPGKNAYSQAFSSQSKESGITIHFVDEEVDSGQVFLQEKFPRFDKDSLEDFQDRGLKVEHQLYRKALDMIYEKKLPPIKERNIPYLSTKKTCFRIEIHSLEDSLEGKELLKIAKKELVDPIDTIEVTKVLLVEVAKDQGFFDFLEKQGSEIFYDPLTEKMEVFYERGVSFDYCCEVAFKPGVTDNTALITEDALKIMGWKSQVNSRKIFRIQTKSTQEQLESFFFKQVANPLIESVEIYPEDGGKFKKRFLEASLSHVQLMHKEQVDVINLSQEDEVLEKISLQRHLALSIKEMQVIRAYYEEPRTIQRRLDQGLPKQPTDVEIEILAQTWSEHCKHKIFQASIDYEYKGKKQKIDSLYKTFIKGSTKYVKEKENLSWLISVFEDNAGIVRFDNEVDLCIKVETHNSLSALDPYGGALTGILGVNRDILGCGIGAKPLANMDVFCLAPANWPLPGEEEMMPKGPVSPSFCLKGVHKGVQDGGNKSGIPTVNGAMFFHESYGGKPLIFVGTVGVIPQKILGNPSAQKTPKIGDRIVMVGGRIGLDGIHGATFSSLQLDDNFPTTAVQIGDPFTQKKMSNFLLEARDLGIYSSITDNGAGGLSSSIGEMACMTNGAVIDVSLCPVKYLGLKPFELVISESQERMSVAVPPQHLQDFLDLAEKRDVLATDIGEFHDLGSFDIYDSNQLVGSLPLSFLHEGLPKMQLKAFFDQGVEEPVAIQSRSLKKKSLKGSKEEISSVLLKLLSSPNISSKEKWVRQYDHEVQGATHIGPFVGKKQEGPSNAGVIWLQPHGGEANNAVAIGCGLAPRLSSIDPYEMACFSVDEALRNVVAVGGDPTMCCMLDNFCWPDPVLSKENPNGDYRLGQLVRTCQGLQEILQEMKIPLVSGKDSMKNTFKGKSFNGDDLHIDVLPTLLITAMAKADVRYSVTSDFQNEGDLIYLLGKSSSGLGGSEFSEKFEIPKELSKKIPQFSMKGNLLLYKSVHEAVKNQYLRSCHDISDGGVLVSLAESMIGGDFGCSISMKKISSWKLFDELFNETPGRFLVSVKKENKKDFEEHFNKYSFEHLGVTTKTPSMEVFLEEKKLLSLKLNELKKSWQEEF
jgi:phosphoribosylformylglycinamidine synthase subunit PurSL